MLSLIVFVQFVLYITAAQSSVAPILDVENELQGYQGTIGERNILVDLKPHLQIKNIDAINGICSYHVFKPNNEEFPFNIDIKDKSTGEAVIEVIRKEVEDAETAKKPKFLDCSKRKEFKFLIQAHDCSTPSLASNKVPVRIQVLDHDDSVPKFEQESGVYKKTLVESDLLYENIMSIRARDEDCTNDGYACSYKLLSAPDLLPLDESSSSSFAFQIHPTSGMLSSRLPLKAGDRFEFKVRAFDCLNNQSFVDADVLISVVEKCLPQWTNYPVEILSTLESTNVFDTIKSTSCDGISAAATSNEDGQCQIENVDAVVNLSLESKLQQNNCQQKCEEPATTTSSMQTIKTVIYDAAAESEKVTEQPSQADDNIEDDDDPIVVNEDEANKVVVAALPGVKDQSNVPSKYTTFSKMSQNAKLITETPKFSDQFTLSAWLRRPPNADRNVKEHVLCGTDSKAMNRHHFGLYFYRGSLKFLLRREHDQGSTAVKKTSSSAESDETFYPSLWEWQLPESLLADSKWHYYEVKFIYPNASLYIDGERFVETATNSDIIDAYELNNVADVDTINTYVGACFHARTKSNIDFFEGDIANVELNVQVKVATQSNVPVQQTCKAICNELIELSLAAGADSLQSSAKNVITVKTANLDEMTDLLKKIVYVNKETYPKPGSRSIKLSTTLKCSNGESVNMREAKINVQVKSNSKKEYDVKLIGGEKLVLANKQDLENGIEPFKDIKVVKSQIFASSAEDSSSSEEYTSAEEPISSSSSASSSAEETPRFSKCQIRVAPERNLMQPSQNNEKVMFLQNLLDEFGFKFEETVDTVTINGEQSVDNYESFLRRLTYVILGIADVEPAKLDLIKNKKFFLTCTRVETGLDTNTILVQVNLTQESNIGSSNIEGVVAYKQAQKYVVSDSSDEDVIHEKLDALSSKVKESATNPLTIALIITIACVVGFVLVFAAIKIHTSKILLGGKRKSTAANEENPQMEWDDSGLNITENPLDTLEIRKERDVNEMHQIYDEDDDDEEFIDDSDEEEEGEEDDDLERADRHHVMYSSDEEYDEQQDESVDKSNLEWEDDMNIETMNKPGKRLQQEHSQSNKQASNKFV